MYGHIVSRQENTPLQTKERVLLWPQIMILSIWDLLMIKQEYNLNNNINWSILHFAFHVPFHIPTISKDIYVFSFHSILL